MLPAEAQWRVLSDVKKPHLRARLPSGQRQCLAPPKYVHAQLVQIRQWVRKENCRYFASDHQFCKYGQVGILI
jgi:hypothetical protein